MSPARSTTSEPVAQKQERLGDAGAAAVLLARIGATLKPFEQRLFDRTRERLLTTLGRNGWPRRFGTASTSK
jgi:hypothetical protein